MPALPYETPAGTRAQKADTATTGSEKRPDRSSIELTIFKSICLPMHHDAKEVGHHGHRNVFASKSFEAMADKKNRRKNPGGSSPSKEHP